MIKDYLDEKLHEECGVFGVYRRDADLDVVGTTYYGLYALQHRGQELSLIHISEPTRH